MPNAEVTVNFREILRDRIMKDFDYEVEAGCPPQRRERREVYMRKGIIIAYPWNEKWARPSFTKTSDDCKTWKRVALSFGRFAIVFDINWYLDWMGAINHKG